MGTGENPMGNAGRRAGAARTVGWWRDPDAGNPDPAAVRLVHASRPLDPALLEQDTALP